MAAPVFDLQPMSIGDILDRTIRLYRRHFIHAVALVAIPYLLDSLVWAALDAIFDRSAGWGALRDPGHIAGEIIGVLFRGWLGALEIAAMAGSVSAWYMGQVPTVWRSYGPGLRRGLSLAWGILPLMAFELFVRVWGLLTEAWPAAWMGAPMYAAAGLGALVVTAPALLILLRLILVPQLIGLEWISGRAAVRRSWRLMHRQSRRALVILLFWMGLAIVLWLALTFPASLLRGWRSHLGTELLETVLWDLAGILASPLADIPLVLLYYDIRVRQEAFDLELLARNLESPRASPLS